MGKKKNKQDKEFSSEEAILVAGGSGFIGRHLVPLLADQGRSVVSLYHLRLPDPYPNVFPVCSDLSSVDLLAAPLRGVETVIYLTWENNFVGSEEKIRFDPTYKSCSSNLKFLNNLLKAMEKASTKRIIFLSAVGANRRAKIPFLKEKYLAEVAVLNSQVSEKVILRTNVIYDPKSQTDQFIKAVSNVMKFPGFYPVPKVESRFAPVNIEDLCKMFIDLVSHKMESHAALVELSGPENLKVEDIFKVVSERYLKGSRLQLRGALGNSLVPIFERRGEYYSAAGPKIEDFLSIANYLDANAETDNPLSALLPKQKKGFKQSFS